MSKALELEHLDSKDVAASPRPSAGWEACSQALWGISIKLALVGGYALAIAWNAYLLVVMYAFDLNDLGKFYYDARAFLDGSAMYGPSVATSISVAPGETREFLNMNPPHIHLLFLPLALLEPVPALFAWLGTGLFCLVLASGRTLSEVGLRARWDSRWILAGLLILLMAPFGITMVTGQISFHLLPLVTWAWIAGRQNRSCQLGIAVGLAIAIKPFLLLFLPWFLLKRRFDTLGIAIAAAAGSFGLGISVFGVGNHVAWIAALGSVDWHWAAMNASLYGVLARILAPSPYFTALWNQEAAIAPLWLLGSALIAAATFWALLRDRGPRSIDRAFALILTTALLISPLGWIYYLPLAIPAVVGLLAPRPGEPVALRSAQGWALAFATLLMLTPHTVVAGLPRSGIATATVGSCYFWSLLALWAVILVARPRKSSTDASHARRPISPRA
jgi:hypothetical protein